MKTKKIPQRMCIVCRSGSEKKSLLRLVRTKEQKVVLDLSGKLAGRGAYVCRSIECAEKACRGNRLANALQTVITPGDLLALKEALYDIIGQEEKT